MRGTPICLSLDARHVVISRREALRYMGWRDGKPDAAMEAVLSENETSLREAMVIRAVYTRCSVIHKANGVSVGGLFLESNALSKNLEGCREAFVFAVTLGLETDRLIRRREHRSVTDAVALDALASAAAEGACELLCRRLSEEAAAPLRPRFSAGYGDLSITCQQSLLNLADARKQIGVYLTDAHLMIPAKSVSAIVGIREKSE